MNKRLLLTTFAICCFCSGIAQTTEGSFNSNGVNIRYYTAGEGVPVVLVHGWMADSTMWGRDSSGATRLNTTSSKGFRLIALDCRGHGRSDKPHEVEKYGPEMAGDIVRLLDHLKVKKAHFIGFSMGVYLVAKVAATHPDRVLSAIYASQVPLIEDPNWTDAREVEVFAKAADEGKGMGAYVLEVFPTAGVKPTPQQADSFAKYMFKDKDVKALAAAGRSFKNLQVKAEDLRKCIAPSLFIYGSKETHLKDKVENVRKLLGRSEVKVIDGGDHMTVLARPEFGAALNEFLRAHSG